MTWTDERVEELKRLWHDGDSFTRIAQRLGVTRNAAIGKAHRIGLCGKVPAPHPRAKPKPPKQVMKPVPVRPAPKSADMPEPLMLTCLELTSRTCKWPFGDPKQPGFGFCGHAVTPGSPYCEGHRQQSFSPEFRHRRAA